MKHLLSLSLSLILAAACLPLTSAGQTTQKLSATKANDFALVYTLPQTGVAVTLEAEITVKRPGEFYKYAKRYLDIDNPITAESYSARLLSATMQTYGVPDPEQRYAVQFKTGTSPYVMLTPDGLPASVNTPKTLAPAEVELPVARAAEPTPLETPAARQVMSAEMVQSQSVAKKAELAAQALLDIRQIRSELVSGQAEQTPPDGKSLQLMLDNLEAQERALMAMFVGTTQTSTDVRTFRLVPTEDFRNRVIARISPLEGIVDADNLSGAPVMMDLTVTEHGEVPVNDKGVELPFPKGGLAYSIPGRAAMKITYDGRTFCQLNAPMAQFGLVYGLAPNSFTDRRNPIFVIFDPATGAIAQQGPATTAE